MNNMSMNGEDNTADILVSSATELLIGDSPSQRAEAARNLGRTGNKIAATYLIQALADKAPEVRLAATQVLGDLGDPRAIEPLTRLLDSETSPLVDRSVIAGALAVLQGTNSREVQSAEDASMPATEMNTSDQVQADEPQAPNNSEFTEVWPAKEASILDLPDDEAESLAESYRRAAAERQLLEEARRRSNEEASRRAAEELLRLEAEAESISRLQEALTRRRSELEIAGRRAKEEESKLSELEVQVQAEESAREKAKSEYAQAQAEARRQTAEAKARTAELQRRINEQQHSDAENQRSLERLIRLREDAAKEHREEDERLR